MKLLLPREVGGNASFRVPYPRRPRVHRTSFVSWSGGGIGRRTSHRSLPNSNPSFAPLSPRLRRENIADLTSLVGSSPTPTTFSSDHQDVPTRTSSRGSQVQVLPIVRKFGGSSVGRAAASFPKGRGSNRHFYSVGRFPSGSTLSCMRQRRTSF